MNIENKSATIFEVRHAFRVVAVTSLLLLACLPARCYDADAAAKAFGYVGEQATSRIPVLRGWQGNDSSVTETSFERIVDADAWSALWKRHAPGVTAPPVDFAKEMVVAIFGGATPANVPAISLYRVVDAGIIEVTTMNVANDIFTNQISNLYLFVVLPRSPKPIAIVARSYALMRGPQLQYKVLHEFKALPETK